MDKNEILTFATNTLEGLERQPDRMRAPYLAERVYSLLKAQSGMRRSDQLALVIYLREDGSIEEVVSNMPLMKRALCIVAREDNVGSVGSYHANFQIEGLDKVVSAVLGVAHRSDIESEIDAARELIDARHR